MAKFAALALLSLFAFQAALARPRLGDSSAAAQAGDILRDVQDVIAALAAKRNDDGGAAARAAAQTIAGQVGAVYQALPNIITAGNVEAAAAEGLKKTVEAAGQLAEKLSSIASRAGSSIALAIQTADASLAELGEEAAAAKALLPAIQAEYSNLFAENASLLNAAAQSEVEIANSAIESLRSGVHYPAFFASDAEGNVANEAEEAVSSASLKLKGAAAAVDASISALSQA